MIEIHDTEDFASKLKSLIRAHNTLEAAGLDPDSEAFTATVEAFLDQYEAATPARWPEVTLPPSTVDPSQIEPVPVAYIARSKVNKRPLIPTLSTNTYGVEQDLLKTVPSYRLYDYEIAPLFFKNDR